MKSSKPTANSKFIKPNNYAFAIKHSLPQIKIKSTILFRFRHFISPSGLFMIVDSISVSFFIFHSELNFICSNLHSIANFPLISSLQHQFFLSCAICLISEINFNWAFSQETKNELPECKMTAMSELAKKGKKRRVAARQWIA